MNKNLKRKTSKLAVVLDRREFATVLAALRFWQKHEEEDKGFRKVFPASAPAEVEVATDGSRFKALDTAEITALCERMNCAETPEMIVAVAGGVVQGARCTTPISLEVFDRDDWDNGDAKDKKEFADRWGIPFDPNGTTEPSVTRFWDRTIAKKYPVPVY